MNTSALRTKFGLLGFIGLICGMSGVLAQSPPASVCNFKFEGVCHPDQATAEAVMRAKGSTHELLVPNPTQVDPDNFINYYIEPLTPLPQPSWHGQHYTSVQNPVFGPAFATFAEALAFTIEKAGQTSEEHPDRIASDNLLLRGETNNNGLIQRYYSHDYPAVPITYIDVTDVTQYRFCTQYSAGVPEAKISRSFHFGYAPDESTPFTTQPNIVALSFNNCIQPDGATFYRIFGFHVFNVSQVQGIFCNPPYTFDGVECVNPLTTIIEKGPFNVLETPPQLCPVSDRTDPCDAANGNKSEVETDYSSPAEGGLSFSRYYNSKGPYKSAQEMGVGWRHSYSRRLDEQPDKNPLPKFVAPADQSQSYGTEEDACVFGWDDIKNTVWAGDLASAIASYSSGNVCEISLGGSTVAYFPIRDAKSTASFSPAPGIRTITRPNGSVFQFQQSGTEWINLLNPALKLEQSGANWIFTDTSDTKETYDSGGTLLSITRRNGQSETLEYDLTAAQGGDDNSTTIDRVTGAFGHTLTFAYDANNRLDSVTTPDGTFQYSYDSDNNLTSVSYPDLATRQYLFEDTDLPNHMTGLIDENGDRFATWDYDDAGRAILSELAGGNERVVLVYNADGTTRLTMGDGSIRLYAFSTQQGQRRVSAVTGDTCATCAGGSIRDRSYDANGFESSLVDWNNKLTTLMRDGRGLITTLVEAAGSAVERTTLTEWHTEFRLPTRITAPRNVTNLTYDAAGNLLTQSVTDGANTRTWMFTYNMSGQSLTIDGPRTDIVDISSRTYYACTTGTECGQLQSETNALGHVTTFDSYDSSGRLLSMTGPNGLQSAFSYDARGRPLTVTQTPIVGTPRITAVTYNAIGQFESVTMPNGQVLTHTYDATHYLISVSDNFGNRIDYDYDAMGNLTMENSHDSSNVLKRALAYTYDLNYRLDSISRGGFVTNLTFDAVGYLTAETDPKLANTQYNYDALDRLDDEIDALTGIIDYGYDDHDNLISVSAANSAVTSYEYDNLDNLIKEISPDRGQLIYTYDNAGNRVTEIDARGNLTSKTYDALNRVALVTYDGGQSIAFQYDIGANAIGRLNRMTDSTGQTDWQYDAFGEVTQKQQTIGVVVLTTGYSYDTNGQLSTLTLPSGKVVSFGYNVYQQNSVSVDGQSILSGASYEPFGLVNGWTWGDGTVHSREYDLRGLMTSHSIGTDTRVLGYDSAGLVSSQSDARQSLVFDYDVLRRLVSTEPSGGGGIGPLFSSQPVLLASIQTMKNEIGDIPNEPSAPWLTVATKNVTAGSAKVSLERSQVNTGSIDVKEKIGYLAIETGSGGSFADSGGNTITYEAQITPAIIKGWGTGCFETNFLNTYSSKPVVMASLNSHNGGDGGWLRRCSLNKTALGLTVDEDKFGDPERMHNKAESAGIVAFSAAFDAQFTDSNGSWGMEVAKVTLPSTAIQPTFSNITFRQTYATKPIVIVLPNKSGSNPASLRIRNVSKTGFKVVQVEPAPENGTHNSMPIHYLAIEPGIHTLPDGTKLEVGRKATKKQKHGSGVIGNEGWATVNFGDSAPTMSLTQEFAYDANGNRTSLTEGGTAHPYDYTVGSNRLLSVSGPEIKTYSYDATGNVTSDGIHTYGYDDRGRLTSVDSGLVTYEHDGQGQRVVKDDGSRTLFVYDEVGMLIGEYDSLGTPIQETVYFNGAPVAVLDGVNDYFVHTDHLNTPRVITDGTTAIWRWESDAFGSTAAQEDPDADSTQFTYNLRFPGQYFDDETGLHYNYFRDYDPTLGRYVTSDPIGLQGGLNTYGYALQNPLRFTDILGLVAECDGDPNCIQNCLQTYYGSAFDWALSASPFSLASLALNEAAEFVDDALSRQANRLKYEATKPISVRKQSRADRLLRTLRQFRFANAVAGVTAAAAGGFVVGAYSYCALQCRSSE